MSQVQEPVFIQAFVAQPPVERLDVGILVWLARLDQRVKWGQTTF
jgi:hypothetical protein